MNDYRNIFIVRTDRIGDVVLTLPAIRQLRKLFPYAQITIMVKPATQELVQTNPDINEVIVYDRKGKDKGFFGFWRFIVSLRRKKFDLAIVYHTKKRTNLICFLAGIPRRVGYKNNKYGFLLTDGLKDTRPLGQKHEARYCLDVLRVLNAELLVDVQPVLYVPRDAELWAANFLAEHHLEHKKYILIHPGGSDYTKRWPRERFAELLQMLSAQYTYPLILIGDHATRKAAQAVIDLSKREAFNLAGEISISQLMALCAGARLLISNDSGPVHVACGVGTPVVSIFGKRRRGISYIRWRPLEKNSVALYREDDGDWSSDAAESDLLSLQSIEPQEVVEAVQKILKKVA